MAMKMAVGAITGPARPCPPPRLATRPVCSRGLRKALELMDQETPGLSQASLLRVGNMNLLKMSQRIEIIEKDMDSFKKSMKSTFEHDKNAIRALILEGQVDGFSQYQATMTTILSVVSTTIIAYQVGEKLPGFSGEAEYVC